MPEQLADTLSTVNMTTLIIWDFDWSLIDENSDTWVIRRVTAAQREELSSGELTALDLHCRELGAWDIYER